MCCTLRSGTPRTAGILFWKTAGGEISDPDRRNPLFKLDILHLHIQIYIAILTKLLRAQHCLDIQIQYILAYITSYTYPIIQIRISRRSTEYTVSIFLFKAIKMTVESAVQLLPIPAPAASQFGVEIRGLDLANLSDEDFKIIEKALYEHQVVLFKNQQSLSPYHQYQLNHRFSPNSTIYGHSNNTKKTASILHPDLKTLPNQPQVQLIGNGFVPEYEGLQNAQLKHPHHKTFHKTAIPEAEDLDFTRFYRWHIDAALYGANMQPPKVTTLMAVKVPGGRRQVLRYDDGTDDNLNVSLGTTAFVSGEKSYEILSDEAKEFARTTRVEYAPHPYIWMSKAKSLPTGLGLFSDGLELLESELPDVTESDIQIHPICWKNPVTGKLALQIHPSAVRKLHLKDGTIIDDIAKVRDIVYGLLRPGIAPELVYAHDWEEGDMVLFHNRGALHTVCGAFAPEEVRMFRQCNLADTEAPAGPDA